MSLMRTHYRNLAPSWLSYGLALWLALAVGVSFAAAHSGLADSNPPDGASLDEPPEEVTLTFTEELETSGSSLAVFDQSGQQVDLGDGGVDLNNLDHQIMRVSLPSSLAIGAYTVEWTAVSAEDGDATDGVISFTVGEVATGRTATGEEANGLSPLLLPAALTAAALVAAGAVYVGRRPSGDKKV